MKKKTIIFSLLILTLFLIVIITFQNNDESSNQEETLVYLGDEHAENEILFVFDYACPYCHEWMNDIFPEVLPWIHDGTVKFRTQSMVYLNDTSLYLSKLDQNIKEVNPDKYFSVFFDIFLEPNDTDWKDEEYIKKFLKNHSLDSNLINREPSMDVNSLTEFYTNSFNIEYVPTVFVNEEKIENPFSVEEIESHLQ